MICEVCKGKTTHSDILAKLNYCKSCDLFFYQEGEIDAPYLISELLCELVKITGSENILSQRRCFSICCDLTSIDLLIQKQLLDIIDNPFFVSDVKKNALNGSICYPDLDHLCKSYHFDLNQKGLKVIVESYLLAIGIKITKSQNNKDHSNIIESVSKKTIMKEPNNSIGSSIDNSVNKTPTRHSFNVKMLLYLLLFVILIGFSFCIFDGRFRTTISQTPEFSQSEISKDLSGIYTTRKYYSEVGEDGIYYTSSIKKTYSDHVYEILMVSKYGQEQHFFEFKSAEPNCIYSETLGAGALSVDEKLLKTEISFQKDNIRWIFKK